MESISDKEMCPICNMHEIIASKISTSVCYNCGTPVRKLHNGRLIALI